MVMFAERWSHGDSVMVTISPRVEWLGAAHKSSILLPHPYKANFEPPHSWINEEAG